MKGRKFYHQVKVWGRRGRLGVKKAPYNYLRKIANAWSRATGHTWTTDETVNALIATELDGRVLLTMTDDQVRMLLSAAARNRVLLSPFFEQKQ